MPAFAIRGTGSELGIGGVVGYTHRPGVETPGRGWQVPTFEPGRSVPEITSGAPVELYASDGTCFRYVASEYADAAIDHVPDQAERRPLVTGAVEPASPNPGIGTLPDGDWVVRVMAYFETGVTGPDGLVIAELFFRIRVGSGPLPTPTPDPIPLITPDVPCGPDLAEPEDVELILTAPGSEAAVGVPVGSTTPVVPIPLGEQAALSVIGDACARSWSITIRDAETGALLYSDVRAPNDDPAWISQNRWRIRPAVGTYDVVATFNFGPGNIGPRADVVRAWRIVGAGFPVPDTFVAAANGARVRAVPGCGLSFTLANGFSGNDPCRPGAGFRDPAGVTRDELPLLRVPAWSRVTVEVPGWAISTWNGSCGRFETDPSGLEFFEAPDCWLGSYSVSDSEPPPAPVQFLARPGEFVAEISVHARRDGDSYDVRMYALVAGR